MAIYVDPLCERGWRYGPSCHMGTDDRSQLGIEALKAFAQLIGLKESYFQDRPRFPHYDLNTRMHALAVCHGAIELDRVNMVQICADKRITP